MTDIFTTKQTDDYPIQFQDSLLSGDSRFLIRYMYYRSSESRLSSSPDIAVGQDYMAWGLDRVSKAFQFVVCDGVGQSFLGNIAAKFLGEKLMDPNFGSRLDDFLLTMNSKTDQVIELFQGWLGNLKEEANILVQEFPLPTALPDMVKHALEASRKDHGSETVFAFGRLSFKTPDPTLLLVWMGDTRVRLFNQKGDEINFKSKAWTNVERWSTKHGLKGGSPNVWTGRLREQKISRILVYSDGLYTIDNRIESLESWELQSQANKLLVTPSSDDISLVDLALSPLEEHIFRIFSNVPKKRKDNDKLKININTSDVITTRELQWLPCDDVLQYVLYEQSTRYSTWHEIYRGNSTIYPLIGKAADEYNYKLVVIFNNAYEEQGPIFSVSVPPKLECEYKSLEKAIFFSNRTISVKPLTVEISESDSFSSPSKYELTNMNRVDIEINPGSTRFVRVIIKGGIDWSNVVALTVPFPPTVLGIPSPNIQPPKDQNPTLPEKAIISNAQNIQPIKTLPQKPGHHEIPRVFTQKLQFIEPLEGASIQDNSVNFRWQRIALADGYYFEEYIKKGIWSKILPGYQPASWKTKKDLHHNFHRDWFPPGQHIFRVRAYRKIKNIKEEIDISDEITINIQGKATGGVTSKWKGILLVLIFIFPKMVVFHWAP